MITAEQREKLAISNLKIHSKQGIAYHKEKGDTKEDSLLFYLLSVSAERKERKAGFG